LWISYPLVWLINGITNALLRLVGVSAAQVASHSLSQTSCVPCRRSGSLIPLRHQQMLVSILDLENSTVDGHHGAAQRGQRHRPERRLGTKSGCAARGAAHARAGVPRRPRPLVGILHMKRVARELGAREFDREALARLARQREPYYVPAGTTLNQQWSHSRKTSAVTPMSSTSTATSRAWSRSRTCSRRSSAEFTTLPRSTRRDVHADPDGSFVVSGGATLRGLNRALGWKLPTDGRRR